MTVYFDDGLRILSNVIGQYAGGNALSDGIALRDMEGRLAFYVPNVVTEAEANRVSEHLRRELGDYARTDVVYAGVETVGSELFSDPSALLVWTGQNQIRLLDRRLVGADWLRAPVERASPPPRLVFASLKGGVGRSTALAVAAADFSARGKRVLCIDLDVEAPGLGSILLDDGTTPEFGILDALVENAFSGIDSHFLADMVGPSALADRAGIIDVVPAFGTRSIRSPANVLGKISRAYTEKLRTDGPPATILDQVREIVDQLSDPDKYDVILIDARAGLHETTAASILGLGAEVLFFGLNEPQTFQGYAALFAHLAQLRFENGIKPDWLDRFTMIQGRSPDQIPNDDFASKCQSLLQEVGLLQKDPVDASPSQPELATFDGLIWDEEAPDAEILASIDQPYLQVVSVNEDPRFRSFNPLKDRHLIAERLYESAYKDFLSWINQVIDRSVEVTQ